MKRPDESFMGKRYNGIVMAKGPGVILKQNICVIDGRGGGMGSRLVAGLISHMGRRYDVIGLGTNEVAAEAMKQAGATRVVIGAAAIAETVPAADVILGTLNVVMPGTMLGEITPEIVTAVLASKAKKVLLPLNRVQVEVVGTEGHTMERLIDECLARVLVAVQATCQV
ncbi:MAG: DUF3842 family protein [Nitrospira sp. LK70]|nr:DUF3842 family protein [Nitrospira sp. LK70]